MNWMVVKRGIVLIILTITETQSAQEFPVYWNLPTDSCHRNNISIPLDQFGIIHNTDLRFSGDQIVLFYERTFGLFPFYDGYTVDGIRNGGLPQTCDMAGHLRKVKEDIERSIPREDFAGVAVIDFEEWRPLYDLNWGKKRIYQRESIRLVRERYPSMSRKAAAMMAETEFNSAAKKFFLMTMSLARQMRPFALWGFYGFPYCNYQHDGVFDSFHCSENYKYHNDRLRFVTSSGTALFPSIYLSHSKLPADNGRYVQAILSETSRIASLDGDLPFYPYTKFEYDPYDNPLHMYRKRDLCNSVKQSADRGASGLILWSASKSMNKRCQGISDYVANTIGPTVSNVHKSRLRCRQQRCSGHGTCILNYTVDKCMFRTAFEDYSCACDAMYTGPNCERKRRYQWMFNKKRLDPDVLDTSILWQPLLPMNIVDRLPISLLPQDEGLPSSLQLGDEAIEDAPVEEEDAPQRRLPTDEPLSLDTPQPIGDVWEGF